MSMELFQAGAHWGDRKESVEACARRVETLFQRLGRCDDTAYARWFEFAYSRRHSLQLPFEPTAETFLRFFARRKYRLDKDVFTFNAWTGQELRGRGGMLNFICGSTSPYYANGCLLRLPREEPAASRVRALPVLKEVVRAMVVAWDPDGCAIVTEGVKDAKKAMEDARPWLGWLTYVSDRRPSLPPLPEPVRIERMEDQGTLIILTPEPFTLGNPKHVDLARSVREQLEKAGVLPPLPPPPPGK